jgi:hypothetical protein
MLAMSAFALPGSISSRSACACTPSSSKMMSGQLCESLQSPNRGLPAESSMQQPGLRSTRSSEGLRRPGIAAAGQRSRQLHRLSVFSLRAGLFLLMLLSLMGSSVEGQMVREVYISSPPPAQVSVRKLLPASLSSPRSFCSQAQQFYVLCSMTAHHHAGSECGWESRIHICRQGRLCAPAAVRRACA